MKRFSLFPTFISFRVILLCYVIIPLISALGFFGYITLSSIEKQVEKQMKKDLELVARAIQMPVSYALEKKRKGSIRQAMESAFAIGRVYSAYIYNKKGKKILSLGDTEPEHEPDRFVKLAESRERRGEYDRIADDKRVFSYFVPLTDTGGRINGLLQLTREQSEFSKNLQDIRKKGLLALGLLVLMLSVIILYGHHRTIGTHLRQLSYSMSRIARGDRGHRFNYCGPKEIVTIGQAFNHMLNSIDDAEQKIIEHRKHQDTLERKLRQVEKLAALGRLGAGTAHELGTPLSIIGGKAQRSLRKVKCPEQKQTLTVILEEVNRMERIIKSLLDFSRCTPLRCSPVNPARLAKTSVSYVTEEADGNRTAVRLEGPENVEPVSLDAMRIQQALINLLRNAVQCCPSGCVRCSWQPKDQGVLFSVDDTGPGVPPGIREKIFEPFYTTKSAGDGTGLGLAVAHTVAQEHGGTLEVADSAMGGASFRLTVFSPADESTGG